MLIATHWRCPLLLAVSVYVTLRCPSVRPSVCPVDRHQQRHAAGLLQPGRRRQLSIDSCQHRVRLSVDMCHSARSGQSHIVIRGMRIDAVLRMLLSVVMIVILWKFAITLQDGRYYTIRYEIAFNGRSRADISQLNLSTSRNQQLKSGKTEKLSKKRICSEVSVNSPGNPWSQSWRRKGRLRSGPKKFWNFEARACIGLQKNLDFINKNLRLD